MQNTSDREFIELEKQYWQALRDKDLETCKRLTDFPCIITGPQGVSQVDEASFESMFNDARYTLESFELENTQVRRVGDDVAIVAYSVHETMSVDGKPVELDAADVSTWTRKGDRWVCSQHSEALKGDPFGRDRTPTAGP